MVCIFLIFKGKSKNTNFLTSVRLLKKTFLPHLNTTSVTNAIWIVWSNGEQGDRTYSNPGIVASKILFSRPVHRREKHRLNTESQHFLHSSIRRAKPQWMSFLSAASKPFWISSNIQLSNTSRATCVNCFNIYSQHAP